MTDSGCYSFEQVHFNRFKDPLSALNNPKVLFHPVSLKSLEKYRQIRFMDWTKTNNNTLVNWSDRTKYDEPAAGTRKNGVAYEYAIALSNILGADAWFNIPHLANDAYVKNFAELVKSNLHPSLKTFVEYSNEVWNGMFSQSQYASTVGANQIPGHETMPSWEAGWRFHSKRSVEIFNLYSQVYGNDMDRVVRTLGGWSAVSYVNETIMDYNDAKSHADAIAIAPYFAQMDSFTGTKDQLFAQIQTVYVPKAIEEMRVNQAAANKRGLKLIAYEGGQHLHGDVPVFLEANRDARMGQMYTQYFNGWKSVGGQDFAHFVHIGAQGKYGSWGAGINQLDTTAPKLEALGQFNEDNYCWWIDCER